MGKVSLSFLTYELMKGIQNGITPAPSFRDGAQVQASLTEVEESSATGRWVEVERI